MLKSIFLYPISVIYGFIISIRNFLYDTHILKSVKFEDVPIISVGNITVGGTGKTPHVEFIVSFLKDNNKVAVLSRGYKRKTKGFLIAEKDSNSKQIGDEAKQIKQKFPEVIVAVSESRVKGVRKLLALEQKPDVIILDDGFQHRKISPGLSILLIDYNRPISRSHYLPYGNLRDNPRQKNRANIIIVTKTPKDVKPIDMRVIEQNLNPFAYQSLYFSSHKNLALTSVFKNSEFIVDEKNLHKEKYTILAVTGIANNFSFLKHIKSISTDFEILKFSDHNKYSEKDIKKIVEKYNKIKNSKKVIITTEKDAIKLMELNIKQKEIKSRMFYYPVTPQILSPSSEDFKKQIIKYITTDKTQYRFHTTKRVYYS